MAIEFHLMMPVDREKMDLVAVKKLISYLVKSEYVTLDMPVEAWEIDGEYYEEDECFDDLEHEFESLGELYDGLDTIKIDNLNFEVGFSHYDYEYKELEKEGRLPRVNLLTKELKEKMDSFCIEKSIDPSIDVFGGIAFGLIKKGSEDEGGEVRGVGIYCDGNVAQFMEDAGFLESFDKSTEIYNFFDQVASILSCDVSLQFRY